MLRPAAARTLEQNVRGRLFGASSGGTFGEKDQSAINRGGVLSRAQILNLRSEIAELRTDIDRLGNGGGWGQLEVFH
jgi:hypothetical protein